MINQFYEQSTGILSTPPNCLHKYYTALKETMFNKPEKATLNLLCLWFVIQMFSNDITNQWSINFLINIRLERVLFVLLIISFLKYYKGTNCRIKVHPVEIMMLIFFCTILTSCYVYGSFKNPHNRYVSSTLNFMLIPMAIFFITRRLEFDKTKIRKLFFVFILIGLYLGLTGIFEHFDKLSFLVYPKYILDPGIGIHFDRSRGPFVQAAVFGGLLSVIFIVTIFYIINIRAGIIYWFILASIFVSLYFSYTRSAWLQLFLSTCVVCLFRNKLRKYIISLMCVLLLIYMSGIFSKFSMDKGTLFTGRDSPIQSRKDIAKSSIEMIKDRPLLGFGYGNFMKSNSAYLEKIEFESGVRSQGEGNHNVILGMMVEVGMIGTFFYLMIFYYLFKNNFLLLRRLSNTSEFKRNIAIANLSILTGYFISVQFYDPRFFTMLNSLVFCFSGIVFSLAEASTPLRRYGI